MPRCTSYLSSRTTECLGVQDGSKSAVTGATDVALTLVEAMAQHAGSLPPSGQPVLHVAGPDSWLPMDAKLMKVVFAVIMPDINNLLSNLTDSLGSVAELRRKVMVVAVFRRAFMCNPAGWKRLAQWLSIAFIANVLAQRLVRLFQATAIAPAHSRCLQFSWVCALFAAEGGDAYDIVLKLIDLPCVGCEK